MPTRTLGVAVLHDTGPPRGVDCEIPRGLREEQSIPYKGVETSL